MPLPSAEDRPVDSVSCFDAVRFCNRLSEKAGRKPCYRITEPEAGSDAAPQVEWDREADGYRLPTEAEWEYACRAGTETAYSFGDDAAQLGEYAWFEVNSERHTHEVGTKKPNGWGLHDLHGNVWEWCWDWYEDYQLTPDNDKSVSQVCPIGPPTGDRRVLRGGSFAFEPVELRSAARGWFLPEDRMQAWGFRCVRGARSSGIALTRMSARD
jgi:formylglycine-generating enzyme required for sulfatase activity